MPRWQGRVGSFLYEEPSPKISQVDTRVPATVFVLKLTEEGRKTSQINSTGTVPSCLTSTFHLLPCEYVQKPKAKMKDYSQTANNIRRMKTQMAVPCPFSTERTHETPSIL